jgi:DNA polymerase I-like protein with 3'-5' exonuclease and polymerase domains
MIGTATGRCTSRNPNIMGIPKIFRPIVIPSKSNFGIVECDYSQMEVGIIASLSKDRNLISDFNRKDVYESIRYSLFGGMENLSRNQAKILFLGILYGLSKRAIAKRLEIEESEASLIIKQFYKRYEYLKKYLVKLQETAVTNGYAQSLTGLRRYRLNINAPPTYWENNWFKNFPVQSIAAAIFKKAIILIHNQLKNQKFNLLVPLYDSVVFEAPLELLGEITDIVVDCMIECMKFYFPELEPRITINKSDLSCWNAGDNFSKIEEFLKNPIAGINIRGKRSKNIDWSDYL